MKKSFICWGGVLSAFLVLFASCNLGVGLGDELDLEAPVISITSLESGGTTVTSFNGGVYCHKSVTFTGTATDNHSVSSVYVQKKYSSESDYSTLKNASLSGSSWTVSLDLPDEGVCFLKFVATDNANNSSAKSSKVVSLFVDESAPVASAWYIDRNLGGITYSLKDKETLESLDLTLPENKDAAQNVSFSIKATATDTMGIDKITLKICGEDGNQICEIQNSSENHYAPEFKITHELLVAGDESLANGKHYLQIKYDASDIVTVPSANAANDVEVSAGFFIWWPESDEPKISQSQIAEEEDGSEYLNVAVDSVISLDIFDDDQLAQSYCALLTDDEYSAFGTPDWALVQKNPSILESAVAEAAREKRFSHFEGSSGQRETTVTLTTASTSQTMHLLAFAVDGTSAKKTVTKNITVYVSDSNSPLLIISSPKNNSVPAVTMASGNSKATIKVEGQSLDINGCKYLEFVWVSDSVEDKAAAAKTWLDAISTSTQHDAYAPSSGENQKVSEKDGMKLWSVALKSEGTAGTFVKQTFSFTLDLLNDFVNSSGENEKAKEKFFVAKISRADGKSTYSQYKLAADTDSPAINSISPSQDMQIVESNSDYLIEFSASKSSGLAIDISSYAIKVSDDVCTLANPHYDSSSGTYKATISKSELIRMMNNSQKPRFIFSAADIFGNKVEASYTIVISNLPQLKSISSGNSGTAKLGDTILINASFSSAVSVDEGSAPYLKLKGITNSSKSVTDDTIVKANYVSGSGSTTLVFSYTVEQGDSSDGLLVYNEANAGPINADGTESLSSSKVILTSLLDSNNLQAKKTIKIDGIAPKVSNISIETDADLSNKINGTTYLREGKTLTVKVTVDDDVYIQGAPAFVMSAGSGTINIPYSSKSGKILTFSKKIESSDANGEVSYGPSSCISALSTIIDSAGNALVLQSDSSSAAAKITIDTAAPEKPEVSLSNASSLTKIGTTYYAGKDTSVDFTVSLETGATTEYSLDGGSSWKTYSSEVSIKTGGTYQITARHTDYAGNVSGYADEIDVEKASSFPSYSVEITNPDGNYKAGSTLTFKVSFDSNVNVAANAEAAVTITANAKGSASGSGTIGTSKKATLSSSDAQRNVSSVDFTYMVQDPDEFSPGVAVDAVDLSGITDLYGDSQTSENKLTSAYARSGIVCDGVAPKVTSMTPGGTEKTADDRAKIYTEGNKITLVFSEEIQKASGNITLRQVDGWAIPPVLSASDFNTICNAIDDKGKKYLAMRNTDGTYFEDAQPDIGLTNSDGPVLDLYHGTGQFVGPYKKSMQGVKTNSSGNYVPDTDTKFVLDFDIDIWETTKEHYFGKTYTTYSKSDFYYKKPVTNGRLRVTTPSSSNVDSLRTAQGIRDVLEKAHYHERILDVTSSAVAISADSKTVTIEFPAGLCDDDSTLPYGRKWELVIDKGSFMDKTGNEFGAEPDGTISSSNAYQSNGTQTNSSDIRPISDDSNALVLIYTNENPYFWSDKVATPVVRVDRYSYGFGIWQSDSSGNKAGQIGDKASGIGTSTYADAVAPTGYVRVRIDCETKGSSISYTKATASASSTTSTATETYEPRSASTTKLYEPGSTSSLTSFGSEYTIITDSNKSNENLVFAGGNGSYAEGCKQFIVSSATKTNFTDSDSGSEGIWQTVVCYDPPIISKDGKGVASNSAGYRNYYIRGTTSYGGEPYISPFPLRGGLLGTPYVRATYRENDGTESTTKYYWVSYEVLVESSFLGRGYNGSDWTWNDAASDQGKMLPGALSVITGMYLY